MLNTIKQLLLAIPDSPPVWFGLAYTALTIMFVVVILIVALIQG